MSLKREDVQNHEYYKPILDHGFVVLKDHMGNDDTIAEYARVSYGQGTKTVNDNKGLIRYLVKNYHSSPLESVRFQFILKMPIFVARQHWRHRAFSGNESSYRFSEASDEFYIPDLEHIQPQSKSNKQGREGTLSSSDKVLVQQYIKDHSDSSYEAYKLLLDENKGLGDSTYPFSDEYQGLSRELARMTLPVNVYTTMYWSCDLHNLLKYIRLRNDSHAQYEIRVMAEAMYELVKEICPHTCQAFEDYWQNSVSISSMEQELMKEILDSDFSPKKTWQSIVDINNGIDGVCEKYRMSKRELKEFCNQWSLTYGL